MISDATYKCQRLWPIAWLEAGQTYHVIPLRFLSANTSVLGVLQTKDGNKDGTADDNGTKSLLFTHAHTQKHESQVNNNIIMS